MTEYLFQLPKPGQGTLQSQIQVMMVNAILEGHIAPDTPLPSSRKLAKQLDVARNTVVHAYQHLMDEGFLIARERSGFYVNAEILKGRVVTDFAKKPICNKLEWTRKLAIAPAKFRQNEKPFNWSSYPYPFICGQYDPGMFPIADWRRCVKETLSVKAIHGWATDHIDQDYPILIEQIHKKLLPRRGVWADPEEILITVGAQQGIYLTAQMLLNHKKRVGFESPGYVDAENTFSLFTDKISPLQVDKEGLIPDHHFSKCQCVYTTPSHQYPSTVTMPKNRRITLLEQAHKHDMIIIEDDYESEFNYLEKPTPALKSLDTHDRVIYIGSLSKTLVPGIRLGYIVAPREFIHQARALRRLMLRHPPSNNQFVIAQFLKLGYHDALISKLSHTLHQRWSILRNLIEKKFPGNSKRLTFGGSAFWVEGPKELDARKLAQAAMKDGILFEPGDVFFHGHPKPKNFFRIGFSSIPTERIETGMDKLAQLIDAEIVS